MRAFDAFSGIGGFHEAIRSSSLSDRINVRIASDSDPNCKRVYQRAFNTHTRFVDDIFDIGTLDGTGVDLGSIDLMTAGFPCQPFANVGKKGGMEDPRARTFWKLVDILKTYRPKFALLENVQKLSSFDRGGTYEAILDALRSADYHVEPLDLCAADFGVPQQRRRIYFACIRKRYKKQLAVERPPKHFRARYQTTWHLLEKTMPVSHLVPKGTRATVFRRNIRWQGDLYIDRAVARPICATMGKWHRANQDNYFSESYIFGPAPGRESRGREYLHGETVRRITPLEGLRLQGFKDGFLNAFENIAPTTAYRLIGNAVAVPVARSVLEWLLSNE